MLFGQDLRLQPEGFYREVGEGKGGVFKATARLQIQFRFEEVFRALTELSS